jgi:hypothetical protein
MVRTIMDQFAYDLENKLGFKLDMEHKESFITATSRVATALVFYRTTPTTYLITTKMRIRQGKRKFKFQPRNLDSFEVDPKIIDKLWLKSKDFLDIIHTKNVNIEILIDKEHKEIEIRSAR